MTVITKQSQDYIKKLVTAEDEAEEIIRRARDNRINKLKEAKLAAQKEIDTFVKQEEETFQKEYKEVYGDDDLSLEQIEQETKKEIAIIEQKYIKTKKPVVEFLCNHISNVKVTLAQTKIERIKRDNKL